MAINNSLLIAAPMLQDLFEDKSGVPLAAGIVTCYQDNNRTTLKNWYYQTGGPGAYTFTTLPNPMTLSAAGTIEDANGNDTIPFFYPFDENDQTVAQPYYITVDNANGQRQFTRQNFPYNPAGSGGGGGGTQTLSNIVVNGQFYRNIGILNATNLSSTAVIGTPIATTSINYVTVAPSQHEGLVFQPDMTFMKNANGGADTITFTKFAQGSTPVLTGDITPEYYLNHQATTGGGETLKFYQIPLSLHLQTLDLTSFTVTIQATASILTSPGNTIQLYLYQYAGAGKISAAPFAIGAPIVLNNTWTKYTRTGSFPSDATVSLGNEDDAWFLQIGLAPNATLNVSLALPSLYLGTTVPTNSFTTYDQVNAIISSPRTGDIRTSLNSFMPFGWVAMNDGTIGNATVKTLPTTGVGFARQNNDTWPLFNLIWNAFSKFNNASTNLIAQMFDSTGAAVGYGSTAIDDFNANNQLSLTKTMGQVILGTVPLSSVVGSTKLADGLTTQFTTTFTATQLTETFTASNVGSNLTLTVSGTNPYYFGQPIEFSTSSGVLPTGLSAATEYWLVPTSSTTLTVATSLQNALDNVVITWTDDGTPPNNILDFGVVLTAANAINTFPGDTITFSTTGTLPAGLDSTHVFYVIPMSSTIISIATTFSNAIQGIPIAYSTAGTPTNTLYLNEVGSNTGEYGHSQTEFELATHFHSYTTLATNLKDAAAGTTFPSTTGTLTSGIKGNGQAANVVQPSTFANIFIKL